MAANQWEGLDEVKRKMRDLVPKLQRGAFRRAGTRAMRPVRDAARTAAAILDDPKTAANISKNITTRSGSKRDERRYGGNVVVTKVGVVGGARSYKNNRTNQRANRAGESYAVDDPQTFHWRFLELGTRKISATPFMRPALEKNQEQVTSIYLTALTTQIDKALK